MNKPTVTIAVPVYNEEMNIDSMIQSVFEQKRNNFVLKKVLIYSDASSDNTHAIVEKNMKKHKILKLIKGAARKGKYYRVNQILKENTSDILVILDADIALVGKTFLEKLVKSITKDSGAMMVSAHQILIKPKGFFPRLIYSSFMIWDYIRLSVPNYNNAANFFGSATAFRGSYTKNLRIPSDLKDPHLFLYLSAAEVNGFRYSYDSQILQWPISTLEDLDKFLRRTLGKRDQKLEKLFGNKTKTAYEIPRKYKVIGLLRAFWADPFYTPMAIVFDIYINKKAQTIKADKTVVWDIVTSTKKPFPKVRKELH